MPIPDFQTVMLPLLKYIGDGNEHTIRETIDHLAVVFNLTSEEKQELLPSGADVLFDNRVRWAKFHLSKSELLESPRRSIIKISVRGQEVLTQNPAQINMSFLKQFPEYLEFIRPNTDTETT